jgi:RsbT co-antagonist protein rsbRD N-terminal domain
LTSEED